MTDSDAGLSSAGAFSSTTSSTKGGSDGLLASGETGEVDWSAGSCREASGRMSWSCLIGVEALLAVRCCWRLVCEECEERCDSGAIVESK